MYKVMSILFVQLEGLSLGEFLDGLEKAVAIQLAERTELTKHEA